MSLTGAAKKEYQKDYMKRKRSNKEGLTSDGSNTTKRGGLTLTGKDAVIPKGVNLHRYIEGKRVELKEVPEGCKVLSDGQLWSPVIEYTEPVKEEPVDQPILRYLVPGKKRDKLEAIVQSLKNHNQLGNVSYGIGRYSLPMTKVEELLEVTDK